MTTKYHTLQSFLNEILDSIRKDIKTDYLPGSISFYRSHFGNRPINRLTNEEINGVLSKELLLGNEDLSEWVNNRWVFKHGELYHYFAETLAVINPDFDALQSLTLEESRAILEKAKKSFGVRQVYIFAVLNEVVFPEEIFAELRKEAEEEMAQLDTETENDKKQLSLEKIIERQKQEMARIKDKYEQKLAGVLKKYTTDVAALKAQIRALQKK